LIKFVYLSQEFYSDYSHCSEMMLKDDRPHAQVQVSINELLFCVPLRSNINHPNAVWTDKANKCGLDLSKAVLILNPEKYIDALRKPQIRQEEFDYLRGKEVFIRNAMTKYISKYKSAKANQKIPRNQTLVKYSTLKYFERYIMGLS